jgi:hypothetical protein
LTVVAGGHVPQVRHRPARRAQCNTSQKQLDEYYKIIRRYISKKMYYM